MEDSTNLMNMDFSPNNETLNNLSMEFEPVHEQPAKIKVIGVGGGGGNAVNHMYRQGIHGVDFIVCNTDAKALDASPVPFKIELGKLGAGNVPERARKLALEHKDEIREAISNDTQMLFITAGMGGGTGTGAAPVIAEIAKSIEVEDEMVPHILVVAIVTMPFSFEGKKRREQAIEGIEELRKHVDAILVINNDKLRHLGNLPLNMAFSQADDVLLTAAKGIAEIITVSAYVNIDFRDVNTVMEKSGTALMGAGEGRGEERAKQAIKDATTSVLLDDNDIRGAKNILLYFSYSKDHQITMDELGEVTDYITELTGNLDTNIIWGAGDDDSLNDELKITLIATGFEQKPGPQIHTLSVEEPVSKQTTQTEESNTVNTPVDEVVEEPADANGMKVIHRLEPEQVPTAQNDYQKPEAVKVPDLNDPFSNVNANTDPNGRRVFVLETPAVEEMEEVAIAETNKQATMSAGNAATTANRYLDEIRVYPKNNNTTQTTPSVENNNSDPVFWQTEVFANDEKPIARAEQPKAVEQQVTKAFTPSNDMGDMEVLNKADRIRRMNELLHNNPDGPKMIEEMTTEQLTNTPIFEMTHSSVSDAARTVINSDGRMTKGMSFLNDLPD